MSRFAHRVGLGRTLVAMIAVASCAGSAAPGAPSAAIEPAPAARRIVVLGDSLALSPSRTQNFTSELQERLNASARGWTIVNSSTSGDTTSGGLRRFDEAVATDPRILVLELGANDGLRGVEIATIERNLSTMIERATARGIKVLLCGMETPPRHGWDYTVDYHRMFRRVAERYSVPLVPFLLAGVALNPELNGSDAIHPNAAGAKVIADNVWPYLEPLVWQESVVITAG